MFDTLCMCYSANMDELVVVKIFETREEAEIAKGYLEANGVKCVIRSDAGGILFLVGKSNQEKASLLLKTRFIA